MGLVLMIIMVVILILSFILIIPSLIGLILCKKSKKNKGKKSKLVIRILLSITLLIGLGMFTVPAYYIGSFVYMDYKQSQRDKTLEAAANRGDLQRVNELLNKGVNPDENDGLDYTALTHACTGNGQYDIAKSLIDHKCTVDIEYKGYGDGKETGYTPLMYAVDAKEKYKLVELLIANNADVNHKASSDGKTPLFWAFDDKIANLLIENGADVNAVDNEGKTILQCACSNINYPVIKTLLEHGALIDTKTTSLDQLIKLVEKSNEDSGNNSNGYYEKTIEILKKYENK